MDAPDQAAVIRRLQAQGHLPIRAELATGDSVARPAASGRSRRLFEARRVTRKDVTVLTLELSTLLEAGLPLDKALDLLVKLADREPVREMLEGIRAEVRGGAYLSAAMESQGSTFSRFYLNMVRAGEAGGALDVALARLSEFLERAQQLRSTVTSALIYPIILVLLAGVSVVVMLGVVVPRFAAMFEDAGAALPLATQIVISAGEFMQGYWWALAVAGFLLYLFMRRQLRSPGSRARWDRWFLALPLVGDLIARVEAARFTRTLATLLHSGVSLLDALSIGKEIIANQVIAEAVGRVAVGVREGESLSQPLLEANVFPRLAGHLMQVGEETGKLEDMLGRLADIYDREVETAVQRMLALLEPVLILGLGVLIGGIIMSILVAILSVNELAF